MALMNLSTVDLTAMLPAFLEDAERRFGPRNKSYSLLGVRYDVDGPHIRFTPDRSGIFIEISESTAHYPNQALYQTAHEVVHLLAPNHDPPTTMLEEGAAVFFSLVAPNYPSADYQELARHHLTEPGQENYSEALFLFEQLTAIDSDAVKRIRARQFNLHAVTPEIILTSIPAVPIELAAALCNHRKMR